MWMRGRWLSSPSLSEDGGGGGGEAVSTSDAAEATSAEAVSTSATAATPATAVTADVAVIRDLALKAHPNVVPELVTGATAEEVLASIPAAEAAYQRIAASVSPAAAAAAAEAGLPAVAAGAGVRTHAVDIEALSPQSKIAYGIAQKNARS